jgi:hypothetical protein
MDQYSTPALRLVSAGRTLGQPIAYRAPSPRLSQNMGHQGVRVRDVSDGLFFTLALGQNVLDAQTPRLGARALGNRPRRTVKSENDLVRHHSRKPESDDELSNLRKVFQV